MNETELVSTSEHDLILKAPADHGLQAAVHKKTHSIYQKEIERKTEGGRKEGGRREERKTVILWSAFDCLCI